MVAQRNHLGFSINPGNFSDIEIGSAVFVYCFSEIKKGLRDKFPEDPFLRPALGYETGCSVKLLLKPITICSEIRLKLAISLSVCQISLLFGVIKSGFA